MTPRSRHWGFAAAAAIGLHSAVLFASAWQLPPPGARATGMGGIEISLGAAGGAPGSIAQTAAAPAATEVPPDAAERPAVAPPPVAAPPVERADRVPAEAETVPIVDAAAVAPPPVPDAATVTPVAAVAVPTPQRKPPPPKSPPPQEAAPQPSAPVTPAPPVRVAGVAPEPGKPTAQPAGRPATVAPAQRDAEVAAVSAPAGAGGVSGTQNSRNAGSGAQASAGGRAGAPPEYIDRIRAWLDRHKEYPRPARVRREEGVAYLYFVIDREGKVLDYRLRRSSGHGSLDRATVEMIRRADPLPEMPASIAQARLELVVPIEFQLR